jgi:3-hydroxyisobutyrate dehydrogenase-like beta-hydroxyacid dehydrogenase
MKNTVSVIGLGVMGAALARALIRHGDRVTMWNRTSAKAEPLTREGAVLAPSAAAAVEASPVVVVYVDNYEVTRSLLGTKEAESALPGKILVQLSTGTPKDARDTEVWVRERSADYLDGAIMATPSQIGRPDTPIFVSGAKAVYDRTEPSLKPLAGNLTYMGEAVGAASAWDLAVLSCLFGAALGFLHGARIFESERLRVADLGSMISRISPVLGEMIEHEGDVIQSGEYGQPESSLRSCDAAFEMFLRQAREEGINTEFPAFALGLSRKAMAAGYGEEEFAAVIKVLRGTPESLAA